MSMKASAARRPAAKTAAGRARKVGMLLMDVDGTLTDGRLAVLPDGEEIKSYHVRDGLGILLARMAGLRLGIITGKVSKALEKRAGRLGIFKLHQGILDKGKVLRDIMGRQGLTAEQVAYIGDDRGELEVMKAVGPAAAAGDAHPDVKRQAHYMWRAAGGRGAVREFIEFVLVAQGKWADIRTRAQEVRNFKP